MLWIFNIFYPILRFIATEKSKFYKNFFQKGAFFCNYFSLISFYHTSRHNANSILLRNSLKHTGKNNKEGELIHAVGSGEIILAQLFITETEGNGA